MLRELRFGMRTLLKQPGFTAIAMLTLALGIGATAAVFALIEGVLLTRPPYGDPDRLVLIQSVRGATQRNSGTPAAQWFAWQKEASSIESIAGYAWTFNFLVSDQGSDSLEGMVVTTDYFKVVGLQPLLGRTFVDADIPTGTPAPVVVIGYDLWQRAFHGDRDIVGKTFKMSRRETPPTIIGVMPPGVRFLPSPRVAAEPNYNVNSLVDFWMPTRPNPERLKNPSWDLVARLRPGVTAEQAQSELTVMATQQAAGDRELDGITPRVQTFGGEMNREGRRILLPLLAAAGLVLLIACGNAAALLLVRGLQRQQEYAVRSALGVGRAALFRQVSIESLLLAFGGGALGVALAWTIVRVFKMIGGHAIPRLDTVTAGWPVLAGGFAAACAAALVAALMPALRASRMDPMAVLKSAGPKGSAGRAERRLLQLVTTVQTALTLALLVGAGLLVRTMINISHTPAGYDIDHILSLTVTAVQGDTVAFHTRALERVAAAPGVRQAAFAWGVPLTGNNWPGSIEIEGQPPAATPADRIAVPVRAVTPGYFALLGLDLVDGRDFRASDKRDAPGVAIVNRALADKYFPGATAIGRKIWDGPRTRPPADIVGVVENGRTDDLTRAAEPELYTSFWQNGAFSKDLLVRTSGDPLAVAATVRRELRAVDPTVSVENIRTLEQIRSHSLASRTFAMQLLVGFSIVGTALTLVGIYGVISLSVASRRRELAIRAAVGAQRGDIRQLVFAEGFRLIAGGVVAGAAAALVLSAALRTFLYEVQPTDPAMIAGAGLLFAIVGLLACWIPTRRAADVDPLEALRCE
jgi:putative ABC transport system permease protein